MNGLQQLWAIFWICLFSYWAIKEICYYCFYSKRQAIRDIALKECRKEINAEIDDIISAIFADINESEDLYIFKSTSARLDTIKEIIKERVGNE